MGHWWKDSNSVKPKCLEKSLCYCRYIRHKYYADRSGIEVVIGQRLTAWAMERPCCDLPYRHSAKWLHTLTVSKYKCLINTVASHLCNKKDDHGRTSSHKIYFDVWDQQRLSTCRGVATSPSVLLDPENGRTARLLWRIFFFLIW